MAKFASRLANLETKLIKPEPIHIIMAKFEGQTKTEMFDSYMLGRMAQGYTPTLGWPELRAAFMSGKQSDQLRFISFEIANSIGPNPPIVTNHNEGM